jgi:MoaA/NifB/PqqE/SkfB family radical SAM enzyme
MNPIKKIKARVDSEGRLVFPPEVARRLGLTPESLISFDEEGLGLHLRPPAHRLAKVYIEPTNRCNLDCRICIRNNWAEPLGEMSLETFSRVIEGLKAYSPVPTIFFGGLGEPLAHPQIAEMVARTRPLNCRVELITNGTLLTEELSMKLIRAGLNLLWVSIDGASPESYADLRLGAALPEVLENVARFHRLTQKKPLSPPQIGIAFVAMKRNIEDLPLILQIGNRLGAQHFLVSNVLPYTAEMCKESLYSLALADICYFPPIGGSHLKLPRMDLTDLTREPLYRVLRGGLNGTLSCASGNWAKDRCPFIEQGVTAIRWDGAVSPCIPLLHTYTHYLNERERLSKQYTIGNINEADLSVIWNSREYVSFRQRVQDFEFSPCTLCGGCDLSRENETDCFGNPFPTCGGCLWAQGVIQCP